MNYALRFLSTTSGSMHNVYREGYLKRLGDEETMARF